MSCPYCALTRKVRAELDPADYPDACDECSVEMTVQPSQWRMQCVGDQTWRLDQPNYNAEDDMIAKLDRKLDGEFEPDPSLYTLREALHKLKPRCRRMIEMYYYEGKTYREIGRHYKISKQAAHQQVKAGLKKLAKIYGVPRLFRNGEGEAQ